MKIRFERVPVHQCYKIWSDFFSGERTENWIEIIHLYPETVFFHFYFVFKVFRCLNSQTECLTIFNSKKCYNSLNNIFSVLTYLVRRFGNILHTYLIRVLCTPNIYIIGSDLIKYQYGWVNTFA